MLAKITLAPGQIGYHDALSNVHLTLAEPTAVVPTGANTTHLKKAVKDGKILLISGTLSSTVNHRELKQKEVAAFTKHVGGIKRPVINQNVVNARKEAAKKAEVKLEKKVETPKKETVKPVVEAPKKEVVKPDVKEVKKEVPVKKETKEEPKKFDTKKK